MQTRRLDYLNNEYGGEKLINVYSVPNILDHVVTKEKFIENMDLNINLPVGMFVAGGRVINSLLGIQKRSDDYHF